MEYVQNFMPIGGNLGISAIVALIPIIVFLLVIARKMAAWKASLLTLIITIIIAAIVYKMPLMLPIMSATQGAIFGLIPICWIILCSVFLYNLTVKTGKFDIIRSSIVSITDDRRLQILLIAFSFSAFLEGAAGFGAPVAISAAILVGLGFNPLMAAGICLVANMSAVAFGAVGAPIIAISGPTGIPVGDLSAMVGRILPFISLLIPFYIVVIMSGFKKTMEIIPAILVSGVSFALTQSLVSNLIGPELTDILAAVVSLAALVLFLRVWKPKQIYHFPQDEVAAASEAPLHKKEAKHSAGQIVGAWAPFITLMVMVVIWALPAVKTALTGSYTGENGILQAINSIGAFFSIAPEVPLLHNNILNGEGVPIAATYAITFLATPGTAILFAAVISKFLLGISWKDWAATLFETLSNLKLSLLTIAFVVAFAYVMNSSGMITTIALLLAQTGALFPFFAPMLGYLGGFVTGSCTSANVLFGSLQHQTALSIGMNPTLAVSANAIGADIGKVLSPQSLAVATGATGQVGQESSVMKYVLKHSMIVLLFACVLVYLMANVLSFLVVS
ncbi:L-lactate permease [Bacillus benzoevorans]|uniref:L-lactate permease n=1 Tax=Bacillus benzoevorans TaxID=1456 RepID=A0A7X0HMN7_9BACI|nr:L-lactate permease [Bacillus benzoevorans]MBB6443640.1 lactate permease [Bacillus benzoevorans]